MIRAEVRVLVHRIEEQSTYLSRWRTGLVDLIEPTALMHPDLSTAASDLLSAVDRFTTLANACDAVFESKLDEMLRRAPRD